MTKDFSMQVEIIRNIHLWRSLNNKMNQDQLLIKCNKNYINLQIKLILTLLNKHNSKKLTLRPLPLLMNQSKIQFFSLIN